MAFFKVQVKRESNTPRHFNVVANCPQGALRVAASQLREEGITDARAIEVIDQINSLRE